MLACEKQDDSRYGKVGPWLQSREPTRYASDTSNTLFFPYDPTSIKSIPSFCGRLSHVKARDYQCTSRDAADFSQLGYAGVGPALIAKSLAFA
jgi:hypothetical protein